MADLQEQLNGNARHQNGISEAAPLLPTELQQQQQQLAKDASAPPESAKSPKASTELYPMSNWKYDTFLWVMSFLVDTFFREVHPRGSWKVPRNGPVLFVAAPHANQVSARARARAYAFSPFSYVTSSIPEPIG